MLVNLKKEEEEDLQRTNKLSDFLTQGTMPYVNWPHFSLCIIKSSYFLVSVIERQLAPRSGGWFSVSSGSQTSPTAHLWAYGSGAGGCLFWPLLSSPTQDRIAALPDSAALSPLQTALPWRDE